MPSHEDIPEDDELFDSRSTSTLRPTSSVSSTESIEIVEEKKRTTVTKTTTTTSPVKILLVNGTCSEIFRSALENSVEDCVLRYPGDKAVYVGKSGRAFPISVGNVQNSVQSLREPSAPTRPTTKSAARRSTSQLSSARQQNSLTPSTMAINRIRQQLVPQKFSREENVFEETTIEQFPKSIGDFARTTMSPTVRLTRFSHPVLPTKKTSQMSYRDRQKNYRLSDLVMLGPEHFARDFNLPRRSKPTKKKTKGDHDELERIKQDLFHRYLWTQKPQVSRRICPMSVYMRSATFAILLFPIESQEYFDLFIESTSTPKRVYLPPRSSTPRPPATTSVNMNNQTRISRQSRRTLKRTYCKSAIFFRQLKRTFL